MRIGFACRLRVVGGEPERLEEQVDQVMDELCDLGVIDPWVGVTLSRSEVEISLVVDAGTVEEGCQQAMSTVRSAIHAAGGGTPGWPVERIEVERAVAPLSG